MSDDGKRVNNVCTKVDDRMLIDLGRACAIDDVKLSEFIYRILRRELYGRTMHDSRVAERITSAPEGD